MDGKRTERTGWQVCTDTAYYIKKFVGKDLKKFGHLSTAVVTLLRRIAREDDLFHKGYGYSVGTGGGRAAKPKRK